jgi:hypothetical protein
MDISIISDTCKFVTDNADVGSAWVLALGGKIDASVFLGLIKNTYPDTLAQMKDMVTHCLPPTA